MSQRAGPSEQTFADRALIGVPCLVSGGLLHWLVYAHAPSPLEDLTALGAWLVFGCWQVVANLFLLVAAIKFFGRTGWVRRQLAHARWQLVALFVAVTIVTSATALMYLAQTAAHGP